MRPAGRPRAGRRGGGSELTGRSPPGAAPGPALGGGGSPAPGTAGHQLAQPLPAPGPAAGLLRRGERRGRGPGCLPARPGEWVSPAPDGQTSSPANGGGRQADTGGPPIQRHLGKPDRRAEGVPLTGRSRPGRSTSGGLRVTGRQASAWTDTPSLSGCVSEAPGLGDVSRSCLQAEGGGGQGVTGVGGPSWRPCPSRLLPPSLSEAPPEDLPVSPVFPGGTWVSVTPSLGPLGAAGQGVNKVPRERVGEGAPAGHGHSPPALPSTRSSSARACRWCWLWFPPASSTPP